MINPSTAEKDCKDCPIRHRAVCSQCEPDELLQLAAIKFYRNYEAGQTIVWAGDDMGFVASVVRGAATLSKSLEDGRRQMVGLLLPSDFVGRPGRRLAPFDVVAVNDLTLCCFRRKPFEALMQATPHVADRLLHMTLDELDAARSWMLVLGRKTAREKIASLLAILAKREANAPSAKSRKSVQIDLPFTRETMADYLGLTLETVSRQISALKVDGIIELTSARQIKVPDIGRLQAETGEDVQTDLHA